MSVSRQNMGSMYSFESQLNKYLETSESEDLEDYPGAERLEYDFTAERMIAFNTTNLFEATAHLVKGCIGAGILSVHVGFMYGGLWTSLIFSIIIIIIVSNNMMMLVKSAHILYVKLRISKLSYPDLAEVAVATGPWKTIRRFSKIFRYTVDVCLFLEMFGTCCIYEIIIASTIKQGLETISQVIKDADLQIRFYIMFTAAPLVAISYIRSLKILAPFSIVADTFIVACVLATMAYSLKAADNIGERPAWKSFHGFLRFWGVYLYSIEGVAVTLPIENSMKKPKKFFIVLQYGMSIVGALTILTGFFGYWGWGENCKSPITAHLPTSVAPLIVLLLLAMMLCVTFAIHFWVPFRVVWYYIGRLHKSKHAIWEKFYRSVMALLIACLAIALPSSMGWMIFLGNFFLAFIAFIFPALIESLVTWKEPRKGKVRWTFMKNIIIIIFGFVLSIGAFYSAVDIIELY